MKKVQVQVERAADGSYWCNMYIGNGGYHSCGNSVEEAKQDLMVCLEDASKAHEEGLEDLSELQFEYKYDLQSFFDFFSYLNVNEIARRSDINPSLLRQYRSGKKNAGESAYKRLAGCIGEIKKEIQAATF